VTDDHGASDNFNFIFQQSAGSNGMTLTGTAGNDAIFATNGSDNLTGNTGHDTFVFNDLAGTDVVTDFHQGDDHIQLCATDVADFSALLAMTSDNTNGDAVIAVSAQDSITLLGVHKAALTANDFHIV
jgi:Ca2+-binding RTX toxin-like protein